MPDTKISAMTDAGALTGSEQLPVIRGGVNYRTTPAGIVALAVGITGPQGAPGQSYGSALLSGGGAIWTGTLSVTITAATYAINGTVYSSAQTDLTFAAGNATNPRIDIIALNTSGAAVIVQGTAAVNPAEPQIDPLTQLKLYYVYIPALAAALSITNTLVYREDTEWTTSVSGGTIVKNSTSNPFAGTKDVEATTAINGDWVEFDKGSTFDSTLANTLTMRLRSKAAWPNAKTLVWQFRNAAGVPQGFGVAVKTGIFGYDSSNLSYLGVSIPIGNFGIAGLTVQKLRATITGGGAGIGFYLDDVIIQGGIAPAQPTPYMRWMGPYSNTTQYVLNDVTSYRNKTYVSAGTTLGVFPPNAPWTDLAPDSIRAISDQATIVWDLSDSPAAAVTITANRTVGAPTNIMAGRSYALTVIQPPSGGPWTLTWNSVFKWPGGTPPVLSTAANAIDVVTFMGGINGVTLNGVIQKGFA